MPFQIIRDDLTQMQVDAIVNTANPAPAVGWGLDQGIHTAAGPDLLRARKKIGDIVPGCSAITPGFRLRARYVIHTVGPIWIDGKHGEPETLSSCYASALDLARRAGCASVALPLISTGNYCFPSALALQIAMGEISKFLMDHDLFVYLVVFNKEAFRLTEKLFSNITSFIDDNYVEEKETEEYCICMPEAEAFDYWNVESRSVCYSDEASLPSAKREQASCSFAPCEKKSLTELLQKTDAGFSETLLRLIDERGCKDSEIYKRANITKQHFYKIRKNPDYKPTKPTAIALAIALRLDLDQTKDLIGRAGYALTNSSKFDVIIMYFIREKNYDLFEINAALFDFDQCLLGGTV